MFGQSEVTRTGVAIVVELLFDVDHISTGIVQLSKLCTTAQIPQVTELRKPRPGGSVVIATRPPGADGTV